MKKYKRILLVLTILFILPMSVFAKEKINVYMFKQEGCSHCTDALTFFNNLDEEYKSYFNLITKDVKESDTNVLLKKVVNHFRVNMNGTPFIVIGNQTFEGFNDEIAEKIKVSIKNNYENEAGDVVAALIKQMQVRKKNSSSIVWIILAIIIGIFFLSYMAKDNQKKEVPKKQTSKRKAKK